MKSRKKVYIDGDFTSLTGNNLKEIVEDYFNQKGIDSHVAMDVAIPSALKAKDRIASRSSDYLLFLTTMFTNDPYVIHQITKSAITDRDKTLLCLLVWNWASVERYVSILSVYEDIKSIGVKCFKGEVDKVFGDISNFIIN